MADDHFFRTSMRLIETRPTIYLLTQILSMEYFKPIEPPETFKAINAELGITIVDPQIY